jgi:hypothetical protein
MTGTAHIPIREPQSAARPASSIHSILRAEGAQRIIATRRKAAANISPTTNTP